MASELEPWIAAGLRALPRHSCRFFDNSPSRGDDAFDETVSYAYDANDRLVTETKDATGDANDHHTVYSYGLDGTATQLTGKTVQEGLDAQGTVLEDTQYTYNLQGRLSSATIDKTGSGGGTSTSSYEYDDAGIRVSKTVDGQKTLHLVDHDNATGYAQVLQEIDAATVTVLRSYTLGLDGKGIPGTQYSFR